MALAQPNNRPPIKVLPYGQPTHGKTTFAASFPRPLLVFGFDEQAKMLPYLFGGHHYTKTMLKYAATEQVLVQQVKNEKGDPESLVRVESYFETNPEAPRAWQTFRYQRLRNFDHTEWRTIVIDSATSVAAAIRYWDELVKNRGAADGRQHYGAARAQLEWFLRSVIPSWIHANVVLISHIARPDKLSIRRMPAMPGELKEQVSGAFAEVYRCSVERTQNGSITYVMQTKATPEFEAGTMIKAGGERGLCAPNYEALWTDYTAPETRPVAGSAAGEVPALLNDPFAPPPAPVVEEEEEEAVA